MLVSVQVRTLLQGVINFCDFVFVVVAVSIFKTLEFLHYIVLGVGKSFARKSCKSPFSFS